MNKKKKSKNIHFSKSKIKSIYLKLEQTNIETFNPNNIRNLKNSFNNIIFTMSESQRFNICIPSLKYLFFFTSVFENVF